MVTPAPKPATPSSAWEAALDVWLVGMESSESDGAPVGLQFEVRPTSLWVRLAAPGKAGWVRTNISWQHVQFGWTKASVSPHVQRLLEEMLSLASQSPGAYLGYGQEAIIDLVEVRSRRIWDLLAEAHEAGMPLVQVGKGPGSVLIAREPVRVIMGARQDEQEIVLSPALMDGDVVINRDACVFVGDPVHGLVWRDQSGDGPLRLGPLARALDGSVRRALGGPPVRVPAAARERFFEHVYPELRGAVEVVSDGSIELPESGRAQLALAVAVLGEGGLRLAWSWRTPFGGRDRVEPLWTTGPASLRAGQQALPVPDLDHREALLRRVVELVAKPVPTMVDDGPRLLETATITGDQLVRFLSEVLPALSELDDVEIEAPAEVLGLDYHEIDDRPVITFASGDADDGDERDWFDLAVEITVDGERVPFQQLFVALAEERELLLLPSGAYLSLDRPEFRQLAALIAESRELEDAPPGVVRVGRLQASLWADLAEVGAVTGAAAAWQRSIAACYLTMPVATSRPCGFAGRAAALPEGRAALAGGASRPRAGWHPRRRHGSGQDDPGAGVHVSCQVRRACEPVDNHSRRVCEPVDNNHCRRAEQQTLPGGGAGECRLQLGQRGASVHPRPGRAGGDADAVPADGPPDRSRGRRGHRRHVVHPVPVGVRRLSHRRLGRAGARRGPVRQEPAVAGLPLRDESCRRRSSSRSPARRWRTTWPSCGRSCSITAPGLFPRLDRFTEYYRDPIERGHDRAAWSSCGGGSGRSCCAAASPTSRSTCRPSRSRSSSWSSIRKHRKVYQTYLQRERQKVLGLLGDLEQATGSRSSDR